MKSKSARVAKVVALAVVPLSLAGVVAKQGQQRRAEAASQQWRQLILNVQETFPPSEDEVRAHPERERLHQAQLLLDQGADINARDPAGKTLLYVAAVGADSELVRLLLSHGADPNQIFHSTLKSTILGTLHAMMSAEETGLQQSNPHAQIIQLLKAAGAKE